MSGTRRPWFLLATLAVLCLTTIAFAPSLQGPFIFDDHVAIGGNPSITNLWSITGPLHPPADSPMAGRPVVNYSMAFNYWINSLAGIDQSTDPGDPDKTVSYHVVNILLHLTCGLVLLGILRRTFRHGSFGEPWASHADGIALFITAVWLLHPLQTEAVDYITQRTEVIVSLCYLGMLYCSIRAGEAEGDGVPSRIPWGWYAAGTIACALGMASKEVMFSAPLMVVLYDRAFRFGSWRELLHASKSRRWFYLSLAATLSVLFILMAGTPRARSVGFNLGFSALEYLHTQGWAIAHYLRLALVPDALSISYSSTPIPHWHGVPGLVMLSVFAAITLFAWVRAGRWLWVGFLGAWFFLILGPSSSVVPIVSEPIAERRMYLPLLAVIVIAVVFGGVVLQEVRQRFRLRPLPRMALIAGALVITLALSAATFQRSRLFESPEAIWRDAATHAPDNPRAWTNLALMEAAGPHPRPDQAEAHYRRAIAVDSMYADALINIGMIELGRGARDSATAYFHRVLAVDSMNGRAAAGMGMVLLERGDAAAAVPLLEPFAEVGGAPALMSLGQALLQVGRTADGAAAFQRAIDLDPSRTDLMVYAASALLEHQQAARAEPYLTEAVQRMPKAGVIIGMLSLAHADMGRTDDAIREAEVAIQHAGKDIRAFVFAGRAMHDAHRLDLAEKYLTSEAELFPGNADAIVQLAGIKADMGKRAEALVLFEKALRINPQDSTAKAGVARLH
jgi:tetratricopeptide (TPR) repeat protein